jgi:hypothetical protein
VLLPAGRGAGTLRFVMTAAATKLLPDTLAQTDVAPRRSGFADVSS